MEHDNSPQQSRYPIVDTNILIYTGSKQEALATAAITFLDEQASHGYRLAISEFTTYEYLKRLWGKKAEKSEEAISTYERKAVTREVLETASILDGLYYDEGLTNISDGDKIIAATAILEDGLILTANHKDFPNPFFITHEWRVLPIKNPRYTQHLYLALYKPNTQLINLKVSDKEKSFA